MSGGAEKTRILFLDDVRTPNTEGLDQQGGFAEITIVRSFDEAVEAVRSLPRFDKWSLDHDLGLLLVEHPDHDPSLIECAVELPHAKTGMDFLRWAEREARHKWPWGRVHVHSANPVGRENMRAFVACVERHHFGIRVPEVSR